MLMATAKLPASEEEQLPTRSECIVGANLEWNSGVTLAARRGILRRLSDMIADENIDNLVAIRFQEINEIYAIFSANCDQKDEVFVSFIRSAQARDNSLPVVRLINDQIEPGPDTILAYGPHWEDGEEPALLALPN
ncbi:MAG: hypothetical protein DRR42_23120 [Gammaproteobacteria bacterium]|nr:MAG: hypothetical protein DRR42_23120 [Gammaproteobacteria bacterium]